MATTMSFMSDARAMVEGLHGLEERFEAGFLVHEQLRRRETVGRDL